MDGPAPITRRHGVDPELFERFYREHFATAYRGLLRLGVPRDDCEDAAQEVFVAAHRRWLAFDGAVPRHAWLLGFVRRVAWRHRRTEGRRRRRQQALAHTPRVCEGMDDGLARREASRLLAEFLARLDVGRREAFVLGELESLGRHELGAALGVNPNTAYSRLQSARRSFFAHFAALDDDGCAQVIVAAERDETPDDAIAARAWMAMLPMLGEPIAGLAGWGLGGLGGQMLGGKAIAMAVAAVVAVGIAIGVTTTDAGDVAATAVDASVVVQRKTSAAPPAVIAATPPSLVPIVIEREAAPVVPTASTSRHMPTARVDTELATLAGSPSTLQAELALLQRARTATLAGDTGAARRSLAEHAERYGDATSLAELRASIARDLEASSITTVRSGDGSVEE